MTIIADLALLYDVSESEVERRVYTLAEEIHRHYCLHRGLVNHAEARPDQHVAASMLASMAANEWYMEKRVPPPQVEVKPVEPFVHFGDDTVMGGWAEPSDDTTKG